LSEVPEGWQAAGGYNAATYATLAPHAGTMMAHDIGDMARSFIEAATLRAIIALISSLPSWPSFSASFS
jgi:hypothetical protein